MSEPPFAASSYYAFVAPEPPGHDRRVHHRIRYLDDSTEVLPWPAVLVLDYVTSRPKLTRYALDGSYGGDTEEDSVTEALAQAESEYEGLVFGWFPVPDGEDPVTHALALAKSRLVPPNADDAMYRLVA